MSLLVLDNASLSFGERTILDDASLRIGDKERIGLIGRNGSGKSTLLRVLIGEQSLDSGNVGRANQCRIALLTQDVGTIDSATVLDAVLETVPGRGDIEDRMRAAEDAIGATSDPDEQMRLAGHIAELAEELEHFETFFGERYAARILHGLGFEQKDLARDPNELSGGWKMRVILAGLLFQRPDVLFLDEPTNHLDVPSVRWLGEFLKDYPASIVLICHDREFLNANIQRVVSFEPEGLRQYAGNYERYLVQREEEQLLLDARARNQEKELKDLERFVERFRAKATKARQAQSRAKRIKRLQAEMDGQRRPDASRTLSFSFPEVARSGRDVLMLQEVSKSFGELSLYQNVTARVSAGDRIAIIGRNGAGKTTMLRLMAGELELDRGEVRYGANVSLGYYAQHHSDVLHDRNTVLDEVWAVDQTKGQATVRGVCGAFLFPGDDVEKPIGVLSGGERARVLLARILIKPGNLLLMDEPTNHLDLESAEALAEALETYGGTLVFVSHNSAFVNRLATKVWDIEDGKIVEYPGNLREYERKREQLEAEKADAAAKASEQEARRKAKAEKKRRKADKKRQQRENQKQAEAAAAVAQPKPSKKPGKPSLDERIEALEAELKELEGDLADPALFADRDLFDRTMERFQETQDKLSELRDRREAQSAKKKRHHAPEKPRKLPKGVIRRGRK